MTNRRDERHLRRKLRRFFCFLRVRAIGRCTVRRWFWHVLPRWGAGFGALGLLEVRVRHLQVVLAGYLLGVAQPGGHHMQWILVGEFRLRFPSMPVLRLVDDSDGG